MNKLAVFRTFGNGFSFPFREFGTVVRVSWLPQLILGVATYFYVQEYFTQLPRIIELMASNGRPAFLPIPWQLELGYLVIALAIPAMISAALYRVILSDERPTSFVYFRFGLAELFLALMPLVLTLIIIFYVVIFFLTFGVLSAVVTSVAPIQISGPLLAVIPIIFALFLIWLAIRLSLWGPTIVDRSRWSFISATQVTAGNFWRLLGLFVLVLITVLLIEAIVLALVGGFVGVVVLPQIELPKPGASADEGRRAAIALFQSFSAYLQKYAVPIGLVWYVATIILNAIGVGLLGYAYKSIKGGTADERVEQFA